MLANEKLGIANLLRIVRGQDITAGIAKDRLSSAENIATARHSVTRRGQDIQEKLGEGRIDVTERGQDLSAKASVARLGVAERGQDIHKGMSEAGQLLTKRGQNIRKVIERDKIVAGQKLSPEQERLWRNDIVRAEAALGGDRSPLNERKSAPYITILHEKASDDQTYGYAYTTKGTNGTRRVNLVFEGQTMTMGEVRLAAKKLGVSVNAYIKEFAELSGQ